MEASKHLRIQWSPEFPNYFCVHILERLRDQLRAFPDIDLKFLYVHMLYYEKVDLISRDFPRFQTSLFGLRKWALISWFVVQTPKVNWFDFVFITKYRWVALWIFADSDLFCQKRQVFKSSRYNSSVKKAIKRL